MKFEKHIRVTAIFKIGTMYYLHACCNEFINTPSYYSLQMNINCNRNRL